MAPKYAPDDVVYYEGEPEPGIVVFGAPVFGGADRYAYKVLWLCLRDEFGWSEADAVYSAWYSEACLGSTPAIQADGWN